MPVAAPATAGTGKVAYFFFLGGGHATQFHNLRECFPADPADSDSSAAWFPLRNDAPGDWTTRLPILPRSVRYARGQVLQVERALGQSSGWDALFFAGATPLFLPFYLRYPSYLYVDFSVSRMRELRPWYDDIVDRPPVTAWLRKLSTGISFRATRGIFAMSRWVADSLERDFRLSPDRVHVVLPGANLKRWHYVDRSSRPADAPTRILFVGAEFGRKGGDLLLDWAERTQKENWQLDIVTSASALPEWVRQLLPAASGQSAVASGQSAFSASLAPRLPGVRVHCGLGPNDPELMQLYRDADIFCLPTRADSSSVASLEAMATGLPVLVSAVGGIPELIQSGETGILLRPNDPADLAAKLETVLEQRMLRQQLGGAARVACERFFNVERQIREITETIARDRADVRHASYAAPAHA